MYRSRRCRLSRRRLPFIMTAFILMMMNTWLWANVFSVSSVTSQEQLSLTVHEPSISSPLQPGLDGAPKKKNNGTEDDIATTDYNKVIGIHGLGGVLRTLLDDSKILFDNITILVTPPKVVELNVPTLSPLVKEEMIAKILSMSEMKKEYEINDMMKQIEKNEHLLKKINTSISLSQESIANFEKEAAEYKAQLDELVIWDSDRDPAMDYSDDSQVYLKIQKLLKDLEKVDEKIKTYKQLLSKQRELMIRKLELQQNLTIFESIIHS